MSMNRINTLPTLFKSRCALFILLLCTITSWVSCTRQPPKELPMEISSFKPLDKNEKLVYSEEENGKYFRGLVYRNEKDDKNLLYGNEKSQHGGPFFTSVDKKVMFLRTEDVKDPDFKNLILYGLYMIDGGRGKVYKMANTSSYANISSDSQYTIFHDSEYRPYRKIAHIVIISNSLLKKVYEVTISGEMSYKIGEPYFKWDQASKTFQFTIIGEGGYLEKHRIDVIKKTTERIFRSTEKYIGP